MEAVSVLRRDDSRIIIHFDYDCFYASVVENENPALKTQPLAIQQKQIIVTCNYEARRRGLHKLQLIREAKRICPEVIIVLGEDLTRFRDASKALYNFLRDSIWSGKVEKLGFDEVFLDCTDMVDYNIDLLNRRNLSQSFFCLDKGDPTVGFSYNASTYFGPTYPATPELSVSFVTNHPSADSDRLALRLLLGSHLARHLRHAMEHEKGYTATVGISTNKLLSKLAGNLHKPRSQTTMLPPYDSNLDQESNVIQFMDAHDIGKVPGIGFKLAQKIRSRVLGRVPTFDEGLIYGGTKEGVTVRDVRLFPGMGPEMLEEILSGPGSQKGIGGRIWELVNGVDNTEVGKAKSIPSQISIEDSYIRLDSFEEVKKELLMLAGSLVRRMHMDLTEQEDYDEPGGGTVTRKWLAHPRTLRLSTRPRPPLNADGTRTRSFQRISRSAPMPSFAFSLNENVDFLADRLVHEALIPTFRKLHPEKSGWNLSLVNIAVTNMAETAAESKDSEGRDIGRMFRRQDDVLREWKVVDEDVPPEHLSIFAKSPSPCEAESREEAVETSNVDGRWESDGEMDESITKCRVCGVKIPSFALAAHDRFHSMADDDI